MNSTSTIKSVFITGAGAGIGAATARLFASHGWFVGLYDRDVAAVRLLADEIGSHQTISGRLDVTRPEEWRAALEGFIARAHRLDVLINNAGILYSGAFEDTALEDHLRTIDVNVKGVLTGCHMALPYLKKTAHARVVNLSSASAIYGQPNLASYSATKFAVRGLTEALDNEWRRFGIRVVDVMPLFVQTAMVHDMDAGSIRRLGVHLTPDDVAHAVFTAATGSSWQTPTHTPVGLPTRLLYATIGLLPDRLNHWVNGLLSK